MITISNQTARRFVLGKQGLWPGRRWKGKKGTAEAIFECEAVQLDPLNIFARSQDIVLHSRVLDYKQDYLYQVAYKDRQFFDYGGWLAMYPMSELPYWRFHMEQRVRNAYVQRFVPEHQAVLDVVRAELKNRGPLGNRNFDGKRLAMQSYRGRKETSVALFDMWLSGEIMIHHREGFDRIYDFRENIAPKQHDYVATRDQTEKHFVRKAIAFMGLKREANMRAEMRDYMREDYSLEDVKRILQRWKEAGLCEQVQIDGDRDTYLVLTQDIPLLSTLAKGKVPAAWKSKDVTTSEEVTFLSPLDIVSARGRARKLFDFEYKWEVYTPVHLRRWGYYVLPILYGDDLVARLDLKLDRKTMTLEIKGYWNEEDAPVKDAAFASALGKGMIRFADFLGAKSLNIQAIKPAGLQTAVKQVLREASELV